MTTTKSSDSVSRLHIQRWELSTTASPKVEQGKKAQKALESTFSIVCVFASCLCSTLIVRSPRQACLQIWLPAMTTASIVVRQPFQYMRNDFRPEFRDWELARRLQSNAVAVHKHTHTQQKNNGNLAKHKQSPCHINVLCLLSTATHGWDVRWTCPYWWLANVCVFVQNHRKNPSVSVEMRWTMRMRVHPSALHPCRSTVHRQRNEQYKTFVSVGTGGSVRLVQNRFYEHLHAHPESHSRRMCGAQINTTVNGYINSRGKRLRFVVGNIECKYVVVCMSHVAPRSLLYAYVYTRTAIYTRRDSYGNAFALTHTHNGRRATPLTQFSLFDYYCESTSIPRDQRPATRSMR